MIQRIAFGFNDIHIAKYDNGTFNKPVRLEGAKEVNIELTYDETVAKAGKNNIYFEEFKGGDGTLTILGLYPDEYNLLFGHSVENGTVNVKTTDKRNKVALMFSKQLADGTKQCYCFYNCRFKPIGASATTIQGGLEENVVELSFTVEQLNDDIYYTRIDFENTFFNEVK